MLNDEYIINKYKSLINGNASDWEKNDWNNLGNDLTLLIGAGVTNVFIGSWTDLLNDLAIVRVSDTIAKQYSEIDYLYDPITISDYIKNNTDRNFFPKGMDVLEQGAYLADDKNDKSFPVNTKDEKIWRELFFTMQVQQTINKLINMKTDNISVSDYFIEHINDDDMGTLLAVLQICLSNKINIIINYNFDTIIDDLLYDDRVCKVILSKQSKKRITTLPNIEIYSYSDKKIDVLSKDRNSKNTICIYHVHGIVYKENKNLQPLVFSEHTYIDYQNDLLNWSNLKITNTLMNNHILCVGFSGTDANFRHICRLMKNRREFATLWNNPNPNKIWLTQTYAESFMKDSEEGDYRAFACFQTFTDSLEQYFKNEYDIDILWSKSYHDMAVSLKKVADSLS